MERIVRVKKVCAVNDPVMPTPKMEDYVPGTDNGEVSLPVEYTVEGVQVCAPVVGSPYHIRRTKRNGVTALGVFFTSTITAIPVDTSELTIIRTLNSEYHIEYL